MLLRSKIPLGLALLCSAAALDPRSAAAEPGPRVWLADDGTRVRREDVGSPLSRGEGNALWRPGEPARIAALRAEVVAFQVIVEAGDAPLEGVRVELAPLAPQAGAGGPALAIDRFIEHYVEVKARSRNEQIPAESLGWTPGARPLDEGQLGHVPDPLIPVDLAPPWSPYPLSVPARSAGAVWIDITVPADARPGPHAGQVLVTSAGGELARIDVSVEVAAAELPYRAVSFLAYYEPPKVARRVGEGEAVERQLWQLLHQHHVDAFGSLLEPADAERLRPALDGSLYTAAHGYRGPGAGVPPAAVALGAYGDFGAPSPETLKRVEAVAALVPPAVDDVMLYAIDEQCESPRGPDWKRLVQGSPLASRILVGVTCGKRDPREQGVDLVMTPAERFRTEWARGARAQGTRYWVYNGQLPRSGTMMIDAPITGLMANGWIAASHPIGRWFLWETTFWHDGNRGGKGPIDPFSNYESFHNRDGDACLGDGMLLYPGTQLGQFAGRSIGFPGVLPSIRLKALRRGIQDAGYLALARAAAPAAADAIVKETIPAALDAAPGDAPARWSSAGAPFYRARAALRALIPAGASADRAAVARVHADAAAARAPSPSPGSPAEGTTRRPRAVDCLLAVLAVAILVTTLLAVHRLRKAELPPP